MSVNRIIDALGIEDPRERRAAIHDAVAAMPAAPETERRVNQHACAIPEGWSVEDGCIYDQRHHFFGYTSGWLEAWQDRILRQGNEPPELRQVSHPKHLYFWAWAERGDW